MHGRVAAKNHVQFWARDLVQGDIIDAKVPNKVINVGDTFLVQLCCKQHFKLPLSSIDLADVAKLGK
jgi:hypothetical protein